MTTSRSHRYLYRSRRGMIFGLCRGLAEYAAISVFWIRLAFVVAALAGFFFPALFIYLILSLFIKPAPVMTPEDDEDREFYESFANNRKMALQRLKRQFDGVERRIGRLETVVTDKEYRWEQRLKRGV